MYIIQGRHILLGTWVDGSKYETLEAAADAIKKENLSPGNTRIIKVVGEVQSEVKVVFTGESYK